MIIEKWLTTFGKYLILMGRSFSRPERMRMFLKQYIKENGFILGGDADDVAVENGLKFHIDWLRGQKTGFFVSKLPKHEIGQIAVNGLRR